jgi:hypothetical protein
LFAGIDDAGRLMLRNAAGATEIHSAGDVHPLGRMAEGLPA